MTGVLDTLEELIGGRAAMDGVLNRLLVNNMNDHFDMAKFSYELAAIRLSPSVDMSAVGRMWTAPDYFNYWFNTPGYPWLRVTRQRANQLRITQAAGYRHSPAGDFVTLADGVWPVLLRISQPSAGFGANPAVYSTLIDQPDQTVGLNHECSLCSVN
jgi:hypothetical protein